MKTVKLGTICEMQSGGTPRRGTTLYYKDGTIPWAKIGDIENSQNGWIFETEEKITELGLKSINNRLFPKGTLLFAMYGSVGKTSFAGTEMSSNQAILGIRPHRNILDVKYLNYWIKSRIKDFESQSRGVALKNLSATIMKDQSIPLPPLQVQRSLIAILDKADELRQNDKKILEKYDQLAHNVFIEMFGDTYLNNNGWEVRTLSEIVINDKIITYGIVQAGPNIPDGIPYIRTGDIVDGKILTNQLLKTSAQIAKSYERSKCNSGDIIMSIRATVGTCAILPESLNGANLTQGTARISVNHEIANPVYIYYALKSRGIQKKIKIETKGATFKEITLGRLRSIQIPIPPLDIQNKFAGLIANIDQQKLLSIQSLQKSEELFQSLLQRAFNEDLA